MSCWQMFFSFFSCYLKCLIRFIHHFIFFLGLRFFRKISIVFSFHFIVKNFIFRIRCIWNYLSIKKLNGLLARLVKLFFHMLFILKENINICWTIFLLSSLNYYAFSQSCLLFSDSIFVRNIYKIPLFGGETRIISHNYFHEFNNIVEELCFFCKFYQWYCCYKLQPYR